MLLLIGGLGGVQGRFTNNDPKLFNSIICIAPGKTQQHQDSLNIVHTVKYTCTYILHVENNPKQFDPSWFIHIFPNRRFRHVPTCLTWVAAMDLHRRTAPCTRDLRVMQWGWTGPQIIHNKIYISIFGEMNLEKLCSFLFSVHMIFWNILRLLRRPAQICRHFRSWIPALFSLQLHALLLRDDRLHCCNEHLLCTCSSFSER